MLEYYLCIASKFPQLRVYKTFIDMEGRDCMDLNIIVFIILLLLLFEIYHQGYILCYSPH